MKIMSPNFLKLAFFMLTFFIFSALFVDRVSADAVFDYKQENADYGKVNIDENAVSGAFIYDFPIDVPPGRSGFEPDLSLHYSSLNNDNFSIFGYGWSLDIPYIERINKEGIGEMYANEYFYSSLSGEIVQIGTSSLWGAKVETGEFIKYEKNENNYWTAIAKNGTRYKFGHIASTRQDDPNNSNRVFKWMLEEIRDTNDNYIKYEYYKDAGQIYPNKITYTGNGASDGIFTVEFLRESRNDNAASIKTGFSVETNYRISEIRIAISDFWVKKYELNYSAGDNTVRSLLSTITETGRDEDTLETIILPDNIFSYQEKGRGWSPAGQYGTFESGVCGDNCEDVGFRLAEVNGDGLADIIYTGFAGQYPFKIYLGNGVNNDWIEDENYENTLPGSFVDNEYRLVDINGDGLSDIVYAVEGTSTRVYLNTGSSTGWIENVNFSFPVYFRDSATSTDRGARFAEINGDGLIDIVYGGYDDNDDSQNNFYAYLNNGDGTWDNLPDYAVTIPNKFEDNDTRLADVNGDGLDDILYKPYGAGGNVYINTGSSTGWVIDANYVIPVEFRNTDVNDDNGVRLGDFNGDGLVDILAAIMYLNKGDGTGWESIASWLPPVEFEDGDVRLADFNGDGLTDIVSGRTNTMGQYFLADDNKADLLSNIEKYSGAKTSVEYKDIANYADENNSKLNVGAVYNSPTAYRLTNNDGLDNLSILTYEYSGGDFQAVDRKFNGFGKIKETDDSGRSVISYYYQDNTSSSSIGEYYDDKSKIGKKYRIEIYDEDNNLYAKTINKWENYDLGDDRDFVKMTQNLQFTYGVDGNHQEKAELYVYDNAYGNLLQKINYGEVSGNNDGTFTDTGADMASSSLAYAASTSPYIVNLPYQSKLEDQDGNKIAENKYYYDNLSIDDVNKGNLTKEEKWISGTDYADVEKIYNSYGLVTQDKNQRDKTTDYEYDNYNLYVSTTTNALGQKVIYSYDYSSGNIKETADANGNIWQSVYDSLDRILIEREPHYGSSSELFTKNVYEYDDFSDIRNIKTSRGVYDENFIIDNWYNSAWSYRQKFIIHEDKIDGDLSNFPVYINLNDLNDDFWDEINGDCGDIRITLGDGETEVPREIAYCSTSTFSGELWFKASSLYSSEDTDFYIYYGNAAASDYSAGETYGRNAVWEDYAYVGHFQGGVSDSSGTFDPTNFWTSDTSSGKIGSARDFNGTNNFINFGDRYDMSTSDFSLQAWAKIDGTTGRTVLGKYWGSTSQRSYWLTIENSGSGAFPGFITSGNGVNTIDSFGAAGGITSGNWYLLHGTKNSSRQDMYVNGVSVDHDTPPASLFNVANFLTVGALRKTDGTLGAYFNGSIDEVRVRMGSSLSEAWTAAEYQNQSDAQSFYSFGQREISGEGAESQKYEIINYIDGLDRIIQTRKETEGINKYSVKDFEYNADGVLKKETLPYLSEGASGTPITADNDLSMNYSHDPLGRILSEASTAGTKNNIYDSWKITAEDENNIMKEYEFDASGNLVNVIEYQYGEINIWYDESWPYRKEITIAGENIQDALEDFPVFINMSSFGSDFFNIVNSDCGDIRITLADGETEVPREIAYCSTSTLSGELWFKAPSLYSSEDTDFYIYYGNAAASDYSADETYGRNAVWEDYAYVGHFQGGVSDSSGNFDPVDVGTSNVSSGKIGSARDFNGISNYINFGDRYDMSTSDFSLQAWAKIDGTTGRTVLGKYWGSADQRSYLLSIENSGSGAYPAMVTSGDGVNTADSLGAAGGITSGNWYLLHGTKNSSRQDMCVNGVSVDHDTPPSSLLNVANYLMIGALRKTTGALGAYFDGSIDEARVRMGSSLSEAWAAAEYQNQNNPDDFYAVSSAVLFSEATSRDEIISSSTTEYDYDIQGNLAKIVDDFDNLRNFTYDGLGRLIKSEDLHDVEDNYFGSSTFVYDDFGNLISKTDAKGQVINYTYDDLNRVLTEDYTSQSGVEIQYSYDNCLNGIGRLCSVSAENITVFYEYNKLGAVSKEIKEIGGVEYETKFNYNSLGDIVDITAPDSSQIGYTHNSIGLLEEVVKKDSGDSIFYDIVESIDYGPLERIIIKNLSNDTQEFYTYDPDKLYRLIKKETIAPFAVGQMLAGGGEERMSMMLPNTATLLAKDAAIYNEDGSIELKEEIEMEDKRTENSKTYLIGYDKDGKQVRKVNFYQGRIHEYDKNEGKFKEIMVPEVKESADYWFGSNLPYGIKISKTDTQNIVEFENDGQKLFLSLANNDDNNKESFTFISKKEIISSSSDFLASSSAIIDHGSAAKEKLSSEKNIKGEIVYDGILDKDIDLVFTVNEKYFSKEALINKNIFIKEYEGGKYYEIPFKLSSNRSIDIVIDGRSLSAQKEIISSSSAEIIDDSGVSSYIWPPKAKDNLGKKIPISIKYVYGDDGIYLIKLLPIDWLEKASYPVRTDATISPYSSTGDGEVMRVDDYEWNVCRDNTYGDAIYYAEPTISALASNGGEADSYILYRAFLPFDTSALLEDDVISSARFHFYVENKVNSDNDGYDYLTVVGSSQESALYLTYEDYGKVSDTESIDSEDRKDITSLETGWNYFDLNALGVSLIENDDYTKLAMREGHDFDNIAPDGWNQVEIRSGDYSEIAYAPYLEIIYNATQDDPSLPSALLTESETSPVASADETPEFSAIYSDPDAEDIAERYQIQIAANINDWENLVWDSGKTSLTGSTTEGERCPDISYSGSALAHNNPYYWRIKFWDDENNESDWSVETGMFILVDDVYIQDSSYYYDNVGNITRIMDNSETDTNKTVDFTYDALYRLTKALTINAVTDSYSRTYEYDSLGNMINKSDQGSYSYDGDQGVSYANPHAATQIGSSTYVYDNNGNLISDGVWTYSWDYRNRLTEASNGTTTMKYGYDYNDNRIWAFDGTATTTYVNQYYSVNGSTSTKRVFLGNDLIATIKSDGLSTSTYYVHDDYLGSSGVITDEDGQTVQLLDYYPFGDLRIYQMAGSFDEKRKFAGYEHDSETDLEYAGAGYYNGDIARFLKINPATEIPAQSLFSNPQKLNSYSYIAGNPLRYVSLDGKGSVSFSEFEN